MKKAGIITMYYESLNCGGNLQAFALERFLNNNGFEAEQISYDYANSRVKKNLAFDKTARYNNLVRYFKSAKNRLLKIIHNKYYRNIIDLRNASFHQFNKTVVRNSAQKYTDKNISDANSLYDVFITGSDQVWNLHWYDPNFFLSFANKEKKKISYAASVSMRSFTDQQKAIVANHIKDFDAISVREKDSVELIAGIYGNRVKQVLDPTLLLDQEDWNCICEKKLVNEDYIFCYFLGSNVTERTLAKKFAKKKKLKIVTVPFANGDFVSQDVGFGDIIVEDLSPEKFLSYIKYSKFIFTDSFHAVVFSHTFKKQYFVFNRSSIGEMSSRIESITRLFNTQEHFCNTSEREKLDYICSLKSIDYSKRNDAFLNAKRDSIHFLFNSLKEDVN